MPLAANQVLLHCPHCENLAPHSALLEHDFAVRYVDAEGYSMSEPANYTALTCELCTELSLYIKSNLHSPESEFGEIAYPAANLQSGLPQFVAKAYHDA